MRYEQGQQAPERSHGHVCQNQKRPFDGPEHCVQDDEDRDNRDGQARSLAAAVNACWLSYSPAQSIV